ncbi:MAG TPA: exostosin family protein [Chthoniobacterales bacterium]
MARVVLLSVTPGDDRTAYNLAPARALRDSALADRFRQHQLTDDPDAADLILFAEFYGAGFHFELIRSHPLVRRFRDKCFLFCSNAIVIPFLPGIYASVEKRWASSRTCGGFYAGVQSNEFTTYTPPRADLPYLFSFIGSIENAPVRRRLTEISHPRGVIENTSAQFAQLLRENMPPNERDDYHRRYADLTKSSKFVLCPRGIGAATIRLFETMRMGRVPVILSDGWVPPEGPSWDEFSIRIREREVDQVARILELRENDAVQMGERAHAAWQEWFADDVIFHRAVESCLAIRERRRVPEAIGRWPVNLQLLRPFHAKRLLRRKYETFRGRSALDLARPALAANELSTR